MKIAVSFFLLLFLQLHTFGKTSGKELKPIKDLETSINLPQFLNYLENGNPHALEGVYQSADGRYLIALVKNDRLEHDFIGVVLAADNKYWQKGAVKFNFVNSTATTLSGYYYTQQGHYIPICFELKDDQLQNELLKKIDFTSLKNSILADAR